MQITFRTPVLTFKGYFFLSDINLPEVISIEDKPSKSSKQVNTQSKIPAAIGSPSVKQQMDAPRERRYPVRERRKLNKLDL